MNFVAITQAILGIQPQYDGLEIKPVIPAGWQSFNAIRQFRGVQYEISVVRKGAGNDVALVVDGQPIQGTIIPVPAVHNKTLKVTATIG
jgi:cellobiose phosphorylase